MNRPRIYPDSSGHGNQERWLLTYADMITLLTAFFLLLFSMSVVSRGKFSQLAISVRSGFGGKVSGGAGILNGGLHPTNFGVLTQSEFRDYRQAMRNLGQTVEQQRLRGQVEMRADERGQVISLLSDRLLFLRGQARLRPESEPLLQRIGQIIKAVPNKIQIEGHTCDLPIQTEMFPSNWELSSSRAGAVLRYFTEQQGMDRRRFVAAGYADTRPLAANVNETNRARNRRVEIVILKSEEQLETDRTQKREIRRISVEPEANATTGVEP